MELVTPGHLLVLAIVVAVLFFGWKQLPDMARSLGRSLRIFKTEIKGMSEDDKKRAEARDAADRPRRPPPALDTAAPAGGERRAAARPAGPAAAGPAAAASRRGGRHRHANLTSKPRTTERRPPRRPRAALSAQTLRRTAMTLPRMVASSPAIGS